MTQRPDTRIPYPADDTAPPIDRDSSTTHIARAVVDAFTPAGRPYRGLWPFGARAKQRRTANAELAAQRIRRQATFETALRLDHTGQRQGRPWRPVTTRANVMVIAALATAVATGVAIAATLGGNVSQQDTADPKLGTGNAPRASVSVPPSTSSRRSGGEKVAPIPSSGVDAAPLDTENSTDPGTVDTGAIEPVDPPRGTPTRAELGTPESAMAAWLARWCPFTYTEPFTAAEERARPAMTGAGWRSFDPRRGTGARASWNRTVTAHESGQCTRPVARVSPEAPRTDTMAIVIGTVNRVITAPGEPAYVEQVNELRIVRRDDTGQWRVDLPTEGG